MLRLTDVCAGYGAIQVLHRISLEVPRGKIIALLGGNGAGKSTAMRSIAGLTQIKGGSIEFEGSRIDALPIHRVFKKGIALVPQGRELFADMTVAQNLALGAQNSRAESKSQDRSDRATLLANMFELFPRLRERASQQAGTLSGGEQAMLATARAIMSRPSLLLLDEPSAGLAPLIVRELTQALAQLNRSGQTILLVEQNIRMALELADFVYVLRNGRIVAQATPGELTSTDDLLRSYFG